MGDASGLRAITEAAQEAWDALDRVSDLVFEDLTHHGRAEALKKDINRLARDIVAARRRDDV